MRGGAELSQIKVESAHRLPGTMAGRSLSKERYSVMRSTLFIPISSSVVCRVAQFMMLTRDSADVIARPASPASSISSVTKTAVPRTMDWPMSSRRMESQRLTTCRRAQRCRGHTAAGNK